MPEQFQYTTNGLTVYEGASAFYLVDNSTGKEVCMGDGVDMFTLESGESIPVGTPAFYHALSQTVKLESGTLREAYGLEEG